MAIKTASGGYGVYLEQVLHHKSKGNVFINLGEELFTLKIRPSKPFME